MSVARLGTLLADDPTAQLDQDGRLFYRDVRTTTRTATRSPPRPAPSPTTRPSCCTAAPARSGRSTWTSTDRTSPGPRGTKAPDAIRSGLYPGLSVDGSTAFTDAEKDIVQDVWQRVAEDYAPFEVDVTTQDPGTAALTRTSATDQVYGARALVTAENWCGTGCLGIAYTDVFDLVGGAVYQPAWAFSDEVDNDPIQIAESISHEVGHNLALLHDGDSTTDYFLGHDMWSPIIGRRLRRAHPVVQGRVRRREQQAGRRRGDGRIGHPAPRRRPRRHAHAAGRQHHRRDRAAHRHRRLRGDPGLRGQLTVQATPAPRGPDLDIRLTVRRATSATAVSDPESFRSDTFTPQGLGATSTNSVSPGVYLVGVDGVGARNAATTGYSDYGSLGAYTLSAATTCADTVAPAPVTLTSSATSSSVTVGWQEPLADGGSAVTGYVVRRGTEVVELAPDARSHTFTGLTPATSYTVSVLARTAVGDSPEVSRTTQDLGGRARGRSHRHRGLRRQRRRGHGQRPLVRAAEHRRLGHPVLPGPRLAGELLRGHPVQKDVHRRQGHHGGW